MKLLSKYNRVNITATIMVMFAAGLCYYFILRTVLIHQLDKDLKIEEQEIADHVNNSGSLPAASSYKGQSITFEDAGGIVVKRHFETVDLYNERKKESNTNRRLIFSIAAGGKNYTVSITKSLQETEDLVQLIAMLTLGIVALLLVTLFIVNRLLFRNLWAPFNNSLQQLKQFNLDTKKEFKTTKSNIAEFNELNSAVEAMAARVMGDYEAMKSFTENASHEIQTPLAIINSKLELLMQSDNFTGQQHRYIQSVAAETGRLSKLNQSLLLLTKIDNRQFAAAMPVDISAIVEKLLAGYEELLQAKKIQLTQKIQPAVTVVMNETMAGVLATNLITNAIKHNIDNGSIEITLTEKKLVISNTGHPLVSKPELLFERFKKDRVNSDSLGLGLSIAKKICQQSGLNILYESAGNTHTFTVNW